MVFVTGWPKLAGPNSLAQTRWPKLAGLRSSRQATVDRLPKSGEHSSAADRLKGDSMAKLVIFVLFGEIACHEVRRPEIGHVPIELIGGL